MTGAPAQPPPSAEEQLAFLSKIQRLYAEGDFTATYKFALLVALADLAVELGHDDGAELPLGSTCANASAVLPPSCSMLICDVARKLFLMTHPPKFTRASA